MAALYAQGLAWQDMQGAVREYASQMGRRARARARVCVCVYARFTCAPFSAFWLAFA